MDTRIWVSTESWPLRWNFSCLSCRIWTHYLSVTSLHSNHWTMPTHPHSFIVQKQRQCHEDHTFTFCSKTRCHYKLYSFHDEQASLNLVEGSYIHTLYLQQAEPEDPVTTLPFSHSKAACSTPHPHTCMLHTTHPHSCKLHNTQLHASQTTHLHSYMLHTTNTAAWQSTHTQLHAPQNQHRRNKCSKNGKIQVLYSSPFNLYRDCSLSKH